MLNLGGTIKTSVKESSAAASVFSSLRSSQLSKAVMPPPDTLKQPVGIEALKRDVAIILDETDNQLEDAAVNGKRALPRGTARKLEQAFNKFLMHY